MQHKVLLNESNNIFDRNTIKGKSVHQQNLMLKLKKNINNYLDPITQYKNVGNYEVNENHFHRYNYEILKNKEFSRQKNNLNLNKNVDHNDKSVIIGKQLHKIDYIKIKDQPRSNSTLEIPKSRLIELEKQNPIFYKDCFGQQTRYPNGYYNKNKQIKITGSSISPDAPDWFKYTTNDKTMQKFKDHLKNQENILVFSKYQKWITVNPNQDNRRRPLEKIKNTRLDQNSLIVPDWMRTSGTRSSKEPSQKFYHKKKIIEPQPIRNIYSIFDFRHNVMTDKETKEEMQKVSQHPHRLIE